MFADTDKFTGGRVSRRHEPPMAARPSLETDSTSQIRPEAETWESAARGREVPQTELCSSSALQTTAAPRRSSFLHFPGAAPPAKRRSRRRQKKSPQRDLLPEGVAAPCESRHRW